MELNSVTNDIIQNLNPMSIIIFIRKPFPPRVLLLKN